MDYQSYFETWKERIEARPLTEVKLPNQPIDEVTASAETLAIEAIKDKESLAKAGLDITFITDLPSLSGAVRYCQAEWMSEYRARQEAQKEWLEKSPLAYQQHDEALHHFKFAYRNYPDILTKVMRINDGNGHVDMIQDLIELAVLGEKNPNPLSKIGYDTTNLQQLKVLSHDMSEVLAMANGSTDDSSEIKLRRDKAFTLLAERVSAIREYGRYIFWKDETRREKYYNNYKG